MKTRALPVILAVLILAAPALADKGDSNVRFGLAWVAPTGDLGAELLGINFGLEADSAVGPVISFEKMVSDLVGIEVSVSHTEHDVDFEVGLFGVTETVTIGDITMTPIIVGANFHVVRKDSVTVYLGPQLGYVLYGDLKLGSNDPDIEDIVGDSDVGVDNGIAFGGVLGIDIPIGDAGWMFSGSVQAVSTDAEFDDSDGEELAIDPFIARAGVGKKF